MGCDIHAHTEIEIRRKNFRNRNRGGITIKNLHN